MEREAFMARVATAVGETSLPPVAPYVPGPLIPPIARGDLLQRFCNQLRMVDADAMPVDEDAGAIPIIIDLLGRYATDEFVSWDASELPAAGLLPALDSAGMRRLPTDVTADRASRVTRQRDFADLVVGITGADGGFAESGSLVLAGGMGRSRMVSLIPLVHIALIRASTIAASLSHWVANHPDAAADTANLVFITGPSRTADIEQELNLGVHGPRHLHVIILPN